MAAFTVGDTSPDLTGTLTSNGTPVNLTGASLAVHVRKADKTTVITLTGAIVDAPAGKWSAPWGANDLSQAGTHRVEVQVTYSGGKVQTFGPSYFTVNAQLA